MYTNVMADVFRRDDAWKGAGISSDCAVHLRHVAGDMTDGISAHGFFCT